MLGMRQSLYPHHKRSSKVVHLIVRHTVQDFAKWKPVYDADRSARQAAGLKDLFLWRNADKPNELVLLFEVSDIAKAKAFTMTPNLTSFFFPTPRERCQIVSGRDPMRRARES
jgi:hypothetical protein